MFSFLIFLLTLFLLVVIHEYGHYWVARRCGVKVLRFAFGFGKTLWQKQTSSGMVICLGLFPLGGYVKFADEREAPVEPLQSHMAFNRQSITKRVSILIAGSGINFLFALFAFWCMYTVGFKTVIPEIASITPHSIAAQAGISANTKILSVDNYTTTRWQQVLIALLARAGEKNTLKITTQDTQGNTHQHRLALATWQLDHYKPKPLASLGITPYQPKKNESWPLQKIQTIQYTPIAAFKQSVQESQQFAVFNLKIIYKLISRQLPLQSLASPFSLIKISKVAFKQGFSVYMGFLAIFSVSLGVINLLPLPGLDGGHILYCLIEKIRNKSISLATQVLLFRLSLIVFIVLLVQAVANDLVRWLS